MLISNQKSSPVNHSLLQENEIYMRHYVSYLYTRLLLESMRDFGKNVPIGRFSEAGLLE